MGYEQPADQTGPSVKSILFVCHGNICRSTMAEFVMKHLLEDAGLSDEIRIESAATRNDEIGSDTHWGTKEALDRHDIPYSRRHARRIRPSDYEDFDLIIGMDKENLRDLMTFFNNDPDGRISLLLDWTGTHGNVADPWYTGDFETTYDDVDRGCRALLGNLSS